MEDTTKSQGMVCTCCTHWGGRHGHRFILLRILLGLALVAIVFGIGVKVGELKERFGLGRGGFNHHRMMPFGGNYGNYPIGNMMYYNQGFAPNVPPSAQPTLPQ